MAHVSRESARDAATAVDAVSPAAVVLELDSGRYTALRAAASGDAPSSDPFAVGARVGSPDPYGLARFRSASKPSLAAAALTGRGPGYLLGLTYAAAGAVCGARPGGEQLAAADAASAVGATTVLGDRDERVTIARLLSAARSAAADASAATRRGAMEGRGAGGLSGDAGGLARPVDAPVFTGGGGAGSSTTADDAATWSNNTTDADTTPEDADPFHLGPGRDGAAGRTARWRAFLATHGCANADAAAAAFQSALRAGASGAPIDVDDVAALRACGRGLVEATRSAAATGGGGDALRRLEHAAAAEAAASGGPVAAPALQAMDTVLGGERDIVLARSLWEAAASAPGGDVVGVLGAAHIAGVTRHWAAAGTPVFAAQADALRRPPPGASPAGGGSAVPALVAGALLATISMRKPKVALYVVGSAVALSTPFAVVAAQTMDRWRRTCVALGEAAEALDAREASGGGWDGE